MSHIRRNLSLLEWAMYLADREARERLANQEKHAEVHPVSDCRNAPIEVFRQRITDSDKHIRLQAARCLGETGLPEAGDLLVQMLKDEDHSVRWTAMTSLIHLQRAAIHPLLEALTHDFQSACFREGAHHVLHTFYNQGVLSEVEAKVFHALESSAPGIQAAWAANEALIAGD